MRSEGTDTGIASSVACLHSHVSRVWGWDRRDRPSIAGCLRSAQPRSKVMLCDLESGPAECDLFDGYHVADRLVRTVSGARR